MGQEERETEDNEGEKNDIRSDFKKMFAPEKMRTAWRHWWETPIGEQQTVDIVNNSTSEAHLKNTGEVITKDDIESIKGRQHVTNNILKLFIGKMISHKYTFLDAQTYSDIKFLLERSKLAGNQGKMAEVELGEIIETLRKKDRNWYSKHIYMAIAVMGEDEGGEELDITTHFELGYLNMEMARYGVWDPQKGDTGREKETLIEFGNWARQYEGKTEEEWMEKQIEGPEQTCNNACVIFVMIAMKYLHDLDRMPKKQEYSSSDMPWMRAYIAYIVLGGREMEKMKEPREEEIHEPGAW